MGTPSKKIWRGTKNDLITAETIQNYGNGLDKTSPFLTHEDSIQSLEPLETEAPKEKDSPGDWLRFKAAMKSPWMKTKKQTPGLKLSHLDSIELRGRLVPRTPQRKAKSPDRTNNIVSFSTSPVKKKLRERVATVLCRTNLIKYTVISLLFFFITLGLRNSLFKGGLLPHQDTTALNRLRSLIAALQNTQNETLSKIQERSSEQKSLEERLIVLRNEINGIKSASTASGLGPKDIAAAMGQVEESVRQNMLASRDSNGKPWVSETLVELLREKISHASGYDKKISELQKEIEALSAKIGKEASASLWAASSELEEILTAGVAEKNNIVRRLVEEAVRQELRLTSLEEKVNYALKANGAKILHNLTTKRYFSSGSLMGLVGFGFYGNPPEIALDADMSVGSCWSFNGAVGNLTARLPIAITATEFRLKHIPWAISPYRSRSAPKDFVIFGYESESALRQKKKQQICIGAYDHYGKQAQSFQCDGSTIIAFTLEIKGNHGQDFTCIYQIGIYGTPVGDT